MNVYVYVATTQGLTRIQQVTEEEENIQSVVCLNGTVESLPISHRYHEFVKKGTGLIHQDFGHGAFRLDVSERIDQGSSWQLGFYLAHYAYHLNCLAPASSEPGQGDVVIWATGVIKKDKSINAVAAVAAKLQRSHTELQQWQQQGIDVQCFVPAVNAGDTISDHPLIKSLTIHTLDQLSQALNIIDQLLPDTSASQSALSIGKYEVIKPLGQGGFGTVYLARDPHLDQQVAIKLFCIKDKQLASLITSATQDAESVLKQRFIDEAKTLRQLSTNAHIVDMYDFGVTKEGAPYYTMPYLSRSLKQLLGSDATDIQLIAELPPGQQPRQLPLPIALNYLQQILTALVPVHQAGLTHRDIKPANLLLGDDNQLQLCDFGIAKLPDAGHSQSGVGMGSHNYMSPEQRQSAKHVDCRSDVYSVAVLAYRMISGILPEGRFAEPIDYQPQLPSGCNQLLLQALAQQKEQRPVDAADFLQALKRVLSEDGVAPAEPDHDTFTEMAPAEDPIKPALKPLISKVEQLLTTQGKINDADLPTLQALADIGGLDQGGLHGLIAQLKSELAETIEPLQNWLNSIDKHRNNATLDRCIKEALEEAGRALGLPDEVIKQHLQSTPEPKPKTKLESKAKPKPEPKEKPKPQPEPEPKAEPESRKWSREASKTRQQDQHLAAWQQAEQLNTVEALGQYCKAWPQGQHVNEADEKAWQLTEQQAQSMQNPEVYDIYRQLFPHGAALSRCETNQKALTDKMASDEEQRAWQAAETLDSYKEFQVYLKAYPKGRYAKEARAQAEQATWRDAGERNRLGDYQQYLERYPQGTYVQMAKKFVEQLTAKRKKLKLIALAVVGAIMALGLGVLIYLWTQIDNRAWDEAQQVNTPEGYLAFVAEYENSDFVEPAQAAYRALDEKAWQQAIAANTIDTYQAYREQFTEGLFGQDAEQKIAALVDEADWQVALEQDNKDAYLAYLAAHAKGLHQQEAKDKLHAIDDLEMWLVAQTAHTIEDYQAYLNQHPSGVYVEQVLPLLAQLQADKLVQEKELALELARQEKLRAQMKQRILDSQTQLIRLGYLEGTADGLLDIPTRRGLRAFVQDVKKNKGRTISAKVSPTLLAMLKKTAKRVLPNLIQQINQAMVKIPDGTFIMGCNEGASDCDGDEKPRHERQIKGFNLLAHEVTWAMYQPCINAKACPRVRDYGWGKGERPITGVSWNDISQHYLPWLNSLSARKYRLPTEAQWEYAARAGTVTRFHWGDNKDCGQALFGNTSGECNKPNKTQSVKQFTANPYGLFDMHGNVWEWVQDCWDDRSYQAKPEQGKANLSDGDCNKRVIRGGSWQDGRWALRVSNRHNAAVSARRNSVGFRLAEDSRQR
ncbi:MAG: formylglycine-generating enzyme required for sulfatase activity/serine/threonine protein kinase [Phenylobacterium sp.]|jgi:formylglycine-generating enzyme required for sulfatase activity/serine/threonine protein kinase